jgi:hypothetical protein
MWKMHASMGFASLGPCSAAWGRRASMIEGGPAQAEREIILLSAGTGARRLEMQSRISTLIDEVAWPRLGEMLTARRLMPQLGPRIVEAAAGRVPDDFAEAVDRAVDTVRRQGAFLMLVCQRLMLLLAEAGIRSTSLKGPFLAEAVYGDPGRRLSGDIDLLVSPHDLGAAVLVLREMGYRAPSDYVDDSGLPLLHFTLVHELGELPPVELHWRIHWYESRFAEDRLLAPAEACAPNWRPAASADLVALLLFYARDGFIDLRLATDLGAWWDRFGAEVWPDAFDDMLRGYPPLGPVVLASLEVAKCVVGLPVPRIVRCHPKLGARARMAVRLANPDPTTSQSQLYADTGLIDGLLSPPGGLRAFIARKVLLPRAVFDSYAASTPDWRAKTPLDYGLRVVCRFGLTLLRALRRQRPC